MSAIHSALENLHTVIGNLERSVDTLEMTRVGEQRDMFQQPSNENGLDKAKGVMIAQRLDSAIEKVERLLKETSAA